MKEKQINIIISFATSMVMYGLSSFLTATRDKIAILVIGTAVLIWVWFFRTVHYDSSLKDQTKPVQKPKNAPISQGSISVYCKTSERIISVARKIAERRSLEFVEMDTDFHYLLEELKYFEIQTISTIDSLVQKYENEAFLLSNYLTPKSGVNTGLVIQLVLWIHAIETGGLDKLINFFTHTGSTDRPKSFAGEIYDDYQHIKIYKT